MYAALFKDFIKKTNLLLVLGVLSVCIACILVSESLMNGLILAKDAPFSNPPNPFDKNLLVGIWTVRYSGSSNEKLILQSDGKFKQIYYEQGKIDESDWNTWWVEPLSDGTIYLHLQGAKYYFADVIDPYDYNKFCPTNDTTCQKVMKNMQDNRITSYDWIRNKWVDVTGQLVLQIRMASSGEILLAHLWKTSEGGFPLIGGETEIFRKQD